MSLSTLRVFKSTDGSAPSLTGQAGALLTVLDAILVNGYGSQTAAGWTKPYANSGNVGCYKQAAGSGFCLSINDNGPNGTSTYKEARITGYETLSAVATGTGQFPLASANQGVSPYGFLVARKSNTADGTARTWICLADASTFYFFALTGDVAGTYWMWCFGDCYSVGGSGDAYRCLISGRTSENSATGSPEVADVMSLLAGGTGTTWGYLARTVGGGGSSVKFAMQGDMGKTQITASYNVQYLGTSGLQTPNSSDNAYYISPCWVVESTGAIIRGRLRGFWHLCHPATSFSDGQTFTGANDTVGKTFVVIKNSGTGGSGNAGCFCMETSTGTVETN